MARKNTGLNLYKRNDMHFLEKLVDALNGCDFSGKNFRKFGPHQYSLMVDNYQIYVAQTGVFYYPTKLDKLFGRLKYDYKSGKFERYEVSVFENRFPMHIQECPELLHGTPVDINVWRGNYNTLLMAATMVNDRGFYRTSCFDARPQEMFNMQNSHLFAPAKKLYCNFESQDANVAIKQMADKKEYSLMPIRDKYEMDKHRECLLRKIRETLNRKK